MSSKKVKKLSIIQTILNKINVSDEYTKKDKYKFDKVHDNAFPMHGYNEIGDLLMLPTTKEGYKYILSVVDIWSNYFDIEPMKTKTAKETLTALLKIFKRNYIDQPKASFKTDSGNEFKEVFEKWLREHNIAHLKNLPDRHSQMANVENLNKQVGKLIMTYLTAKSIEQKKEYYDWLEIVPIIRKELNDMKHHPKDEDPYTYPMGKVNVKASNKYKVGDIVLRPLEKPESLSGEKLYGKFRSGDRKFDLTPRKIKKVFLYNNNWRYLLEGFDNVSYAEAELKKSDEKEEKWVIQQIRDKRTVNKKVQYLCKWKGFKVADSTWEPKEKLIEDGLEDMIKEYESSLKKKK